jgi:hypothetical protein
VPDAVSSLRLTPALLAAIAAAVASLWVGFAVVAGATRISPRPAAHARPLRNAAPIGLGLSSVPALRVRPALFRLAPARAAALPAAAPTTMSGAASTESVAPASTPAAPAATPAPARAVQPTPAPRPAPKPRPSLTAAPKHPSGPDFDESASGGFDNSG